MYISTYTSRPFAGHILPAQVGCTQINRGHLVFLVGLGSGLQFIGYVKTTRWVAVAPHTEATGTPRSKVTNRPPCCTASANR